MPQMFTKRQNLSAFAESLSFLSLCVCRTMFTPGTLLQTGAPLGVLLLHFLHLFAQRLGAIIWTTTQHYSYLSTHTQVQKTNAWTCVPEASTYVHRCVNTTASTQLLPLPAAWRCVLCGFVRCFEAPHSWQRLWKVRLRRESPGQQIGECRCPLWNQISLSDTPLRLHPLSLPSFIYQISFKSRTALCCEQTLDLEESATIAQQPQAMHTSNTKTPFYRLELACVYNCHSSKASQIVDDNWDTIQQRARGVQQVCG